MESRQTACARRFACWRSTEGLLLDPVYSGKAFAGLVRDANAGNYRAGQSILFVMTGGLPGLFAYRSEF